MEHLIYEGKNQQKIEIFMQIIYSIYNIGMMYFAVVNGWGIWLNYVMLTGMLINWAIYIGKYKTYAFRAGFSAIVMQVIVVLYSIHMEKLSDVLPLFIVFIVFYGLYGIAEIIYITPISATIIFVYHGVVVGSIPFETFKDAVNLFLQVGNVYLVEYVVYVWAKRNREGSRQLLQVIDEVKAAERKKDDFLANVSHEFRTPINTICGMSEIVLQEELSYEIKEKVQDIQMAGHNLMSIVSDILDFSELISGNMELEEEAYNITSTINDVINMTLARKNEKKIELIVDCDANIPSALLGDEKKLRRIIMNLVDNAIKFTDEGCVSITIGSRRESYGINLIVTVKDTGIGMEDASLEKLFSSFSQVDTSRNRQEGGIGLGLAISHALIQKMGGAITVKSKLGKGSTVQFVVPQKVLDETPIASINDKANVNVATYIDMEQFDMVTIRDEYSKTIIHMVEQLKGKCHICRNFAELQRRNNKEHFSHIFISIVEYRAETTYFDELAEKTRVIVVLDYLDEKYVANPHILKIYKPFYILTIVSVLNGLYDGKDISYSRKFVTDNAHVLVVDDNRMNLRVIEGLLKDYGIKVTVAASGEEALEKIVTADYDFVFMDHMMPDMDGVETLHRIRHKVGTYYQKVPIVALTANAVAGTREMLITEGFSDFLEKPIERSVLERVLKRNLAQEKIVYKATHRNDIEIQEKIDIDYNDTENAGPLSVETLEESLGAEGLDVRKGILYCNGKELYINVLQGYCEDCDASGSHLEKLFAEQDWKNYTIAVHGMKSAMRSIGAESISESARLLEMAGKEGRIGYIMEHHNELMDEYQKLFGNLRKNKFIAVTKEDEKLENRQDVNLIVLDDEVFNQMIEDMEEAMYAFDGACLQGIIIELERYKYYGEPLEELLGPVKRKVEMSDYMSAIEMIKKIKNRLASKG